MAKKGLDLTGMDDLAQLVSGNSAATQGEPTRAKLDEVIEDPTQPRKRFNQKKLEELRDSIKAQGVLEPIGVRPKNAAGKYVIVFGARRYRASLMAGKADIPIVIVTLSDDQIRFAQLVENVQRDDLDALEIANGIKEALDAGFKKSEVATQLGQNNSFVSEHLSLIDGPEFVRELATSKAVGVRTLYYLVNAHKEFPAEVEAYVAATEEITRAGVQALVDGLKKPKETPPQAAPQEPAQAAPQAQQQADTTGAESENTDASNAGDSSTTGQPAEVPQSGPSDAGEGKGAAKAGKAAEAGKTGEKQGDSAGSAQEHPLTPKRIVIVVRDGDEREAVIDRNCKVAIVYRDTGEIAEIDLGACEIVGTEVIENEDAETTS